ncbi:hypothetical protein Tco_0944622, partial [Tanacetum coccineum]
MSTYLKHMGGYTYKQLKGKSFDEIQKLFDKEMKRVNTFVDMGSEVQESKEKKEEGREETAKGSRKKMLGRKRAGKEQQKESLKKQKVEEEKESEEVDEVDEAELKKLLEAEVPKDEAEHEESVLTPSNDPQPSAKDAQAKEIVALKKRIQRLERMKMSRPTGLKRLRKVGMSRRVELTEDQESLGAPEDASKQGRSIEDINVDVDVTLVDETQDKQDDNLMFDTRVLEDDEM